MRARDRFVMMSRLKRGLCGDGNIFLSERNMSLIYRLSETVRHLKYAPDLFEGNNYYCIMCIYIAWFIDRV